MLRNLSVISLLLAPAFALFNPNSNVMSGQTCSGFYYEGINTFYVDCFDQIGNLVAQDENFYEFTLDKVCSSVTYSDIATQVTGWRVPSDVTNSTQLNCCDFYQRTVGYVFTECDHGINALIIPSKTSGNDSTTYKDMTTEYLPLSWNWNELKDLLDQSCGTAGGSGSGSSSAQQQFDMNLLAANWQSLSLQWSEWSTLAQQNQDVNSFDKATLKEWIFIYGNVSQAMSNMGQGLVNSTQQVVQPVNTTIEQITNATGGVIVSATNISEQVVNATTEAAAGAEQAAANMTNVTVVGNATQLQQIPSIAVSDFNYWLASYDDAAMTVQQIVQDLTQRGIYNNFVNFFNFAFGANGFVTQNRTSLLPDQMQQLQSTQQSASQSINQVGVVPSGMENIVAWISENVDKEVQSRCTACQFNNTQQQQQAAPVITQAQSNATFENQTSNVTSGQSAQAVNETIVIPPADITNVTQPVVNATQGAEEAAGAAASNISAAVNETISDATSVVANETAAAANATTSP